MALARRLAAHDVARRVASACLLACCAATPALAAGPAISPPPWRELHFHARKLILTADSWVRIEIESAATARSELVALSVPAPVEPAGDEIARVELESSLLGRRSRNTVWLEPATAAVLQTTIRDIGRRPRLKVQRFGAKGVLISRTTPAHGEEGLPSDRWSQRSESPLAFPDVDRGGVPVSDSVALFWILASGRIARPGDAVELAVIARSTLLVARVEARATREIELDFDEHAPSATRHVGGRVPGLELAVDAHPLAAGEEGADLEFLGMRGSVRILFDPARRLPVEVSGAVPNAGTVVVRLQDVTLREGGVSAP
jgi:hypothetical protein